MNGTVVTSFNFGLVGLSYAIAVLGSFVALTAAGRIRAADGRLSRGNAISAGLALGGVGVWSMHFVGMLALNMDMANGYSMIETVISLVAAVGASAVAFMYVGADARMGRIMTAGSVLGVGVAVMHYLGMAGMRFGGNFAWNIPLVLLSVVVAMAAATAALWLAFNTANPYFRAAAAFVMGAAVCSMHYMGMAAANFVCTTADRSMLPTGFGIFTPSDLALPVILMSIGLAFVISVDQLMQRRILNQA